MAASELFSFEYIRMIIVYNFYNIKKIRLSSSVNFQKKPSRGVPIKSCSENMQQIYKRTPMPKCYFNKVVKQL